MPRIAGGRARDVPTGTNAAGLSSWGASLVSVTPLFDPNIRVARQIHVDRVGQDDARVFCGERLKEQGFPVCGVALDHEPRAGQRYVDPRARQLHAMEADRVDLIRHRLDRHAVRGRHRATREGDRVLGTSQGGTVTAQLTVALSPSVIFDGEAPTVAVAVAGRVLSDRPGRADPGGHPRRDRLVARTPARGGRPTRWQ